MKVSFTGTAILGLLISSIHCSPIVNALSSPSIFPRAVPLPGKDGTFTDSKLKMRSAITCPNDIKGRKGGVVLLVHGTALDGQNSWPQSPFVQLLPSAGPGFDVCWVTLPNKGLSDVQVGGEYVAYAIQFLSRRSSTGKVSLVGHSQGGGLNIPHALIYFPTARSKVSSFVGLAADFHGTTLLPDPVCAVQTILSGGKGCSASFLQQKMDSQYLKAQQYFMSQEIVPTTSVFTRTDEIVIPQIGPSTSSRLQGSVQVPIQDFCGPLAIADHLSMLATPVAYAMTLAAFISPTGKPNLNTFDKNQCYNLTNANLNLDDVVPTVDFVTTLVGSVAGSGGVYTKGEPPLKPYICQNDAPVRCS
ncbi:alpha/beta-hydrolase [Ceraceosorus guamensis]|uniref:Alpha/beta-hydrolase n=1 Tax=Ceraceosorus guamensis TaxID=1522189 RepID=A0A316VYG9_9BASI|nr:alpha/beta-hydrolase [Ceraceosorus guamensis]PWN42540.1 alpha/beta-hydrolase [Ceraceosorus guamensis]